MEPEIAALFAPATRVTRGAWLSAEFGIGLAGSLARGDSIR
jgi:hypothetical protein